MEELDLKLKDEIKKRQYLGDLVMRKEIGGAGHFFGNDKKIGRGFECKLA